MVSFKVGTEISIISGWKMYFFVFPFFLSTETSFNDLENSLMQSDFDFTDYIVHWLFIVINNLNKITATTAPHYLWPMKCKILSGWKWMTLRYIHTLLFIMAIWPMPGRSMATGQGPIITIFFLFLSRSFLCSPIHLFKCLIILNVTNRLTLDRNINNFYAHARIRDPL